MNINYHQAWSKASSQRLSPAAAIQQVIQQRQQCQLMEVGAGNTYSGYSADPDVNPALTVLRNGSGSPPDGIQNSNATGAAATGYVIAYYCDVAMADLAKAFRCFANAQ